MNTDRGREDERLTLSNMLVRDLRKLAANLGINTTKLVTHRMKPGWAGKGKGLQQVLWEHGWIDESKIAQYKRQMTLGSLSKNSHLGACLRHALILQMKRHNLNLFVRVLGRRL